MKSTLAIILALFTLNTARAERTILSGHFDKTAEQDMSLQYYANAIDNIEQHKTFHETTLDKNKNFRFELDIDHPVMINVMNGKDWLFYNIFICPGDSITITFTDSSMNIEGKGENEMAFMFEHAGKFLSNPEVNKEFNSSYARLDALPYAQYWEKRMNDQLDYMKEYFKDTTINPVFKKAFEHMVQYDYAVHYLQYAWRRPKGNRFLFDNPEYGPYLNKIKLNNPDALNNKKYIYFLQTLPGCIYQSYLSRDEDKKEDDSYYKANSLRLQDSIAQALFSGKVYETTLYALLYEEVVFAERARQMPYYDQAYANAKKGINEYSSKLNNETLKQHLYNKLADLEQADKPAPDFTATDLAGNQVKLSDFRGKIVYADFWSTTCVPCVKELPETKKLQERYKDNKDIVFLYISFDNPQSRAEEFIKRKEFTGTHLFAPKGFASEAAKLYNISSIPRYLLIDRYGKLLSADAPRPSHHPAEMIDQALNSN